jgi:hypothetical protein
VKNRFQNLPFKFNLQRYNVVPRQKQFKADITAINDELSVLIKSAMETRWGGGCALTPPHP